MLGDDSLFRFQIWFERSHAYFMSSPKQNSIGAREHVKISSQSAVIDFRLRQQDGQLPFHRRQLFIVEQRFRSQSSAIHDDVAAEVAARRWT